MSGPHGFFKLNHWLTALTLTTVSFTDLALAIEDGQWFFIKISSIYGINRNIEKYMILGDWATPNFVILIKSLTCIIIDMKK